jgi:hypothetical protein
MSIWWRHIFEYGAHGPLLSPNYNAPKLRRARSPCRAQRIQSRWCLESPAMRATSDTRGPAYCENKIIARARKRSLGPRPITSHTITRAAIPL